MSENNANSKGFRIISAELKELIHGQRNSAVKSFQRKPYNGVYEHAKGK